MPVTCGRLVAFKTPHIEDVQLATLSEDGGRLTTLEMPHPVESQLATSSVSFGQPVALERLHLTENQPAALPEDGHQLVPEDVAPRGYQLAMLPESCWQLVASKVWHLAENQLTRHRD